MFFYYFLVAVGAYALFQLLMSLIASRRQSHSAPPADEEASFDVPISQNSEDPWDRSRGAVDHPDYPIVAQEDSERMGIDRW